MSDSAVLKGLAHPLRARLYYVLFARGTARATDLARELDAPVNQISQHLRYMAKYGIIEEATGLATDKRERVWRPASSMGLAPDPDATAAPAYEEIGRRSAHATLDAYLTNARPGFHHANDITVHLSPDEVEEFANEVQELLLRWNRLGQDRNAADPETERVTYLTNVYIHPLPAD
ncbi:helix-turn-helix domain-containing protein [Microlunatus endophyticus]